MKRYLFIICWLLFVNLSVFAQGGLTAILDSSQLLIGARMHIGLELNESPEFSPLSTSIPGIDTIQPVEIISTSAWDYKDGMWKGDMEITVFDTGYFLLPPIALSGDRNGEAMTYYSKRLVVSVYAMPVDSSGVMPIKPIVEEPLNWQDFKFLLVGIGVLLMIVLFIWLFKKFNPSVDEVIPYVPPRRAHIIALEKLDHLENKGLWKKGLIKEYYVELGDILREYFENRFEFPALEMTSAELDKVMSKSDDIRIYREKANEFFSMADLVKFAKALPEENIHKEWFNWVKEVIVSTQSAEEDNLEHQNEERE